MGNKEPEESTHHQLWIHHFFLTVTITNIINNRNSINNLSVEDKDIIVNEISLIILIDGGLGGIDSGK